MPVTIGRRDVIAALGGGGGMVGHGARAATSDAAGRVSPRRVT
jgi:hypothetical protein